jgi:hypothetical protein
LQAHTVRRGLKIWKFLILLLDEQVIIVFERSYSAIVVLKTDKSFSNLQSSIYENRN